MPNLYERKEHLKMLEPSLRFLPMHTHLAHPTVRQQTLDIRLKRCQSGEFTSEYTVPYPSQGHFLHSCYQYIWGHPAHLDRHLAFIPALRKQGSFAPQSVVQDLSLVQWFSNFKVQQNLESLLKHIFLGPTPRASHSEGPKNLHF